MGRAGRATADPGTPPPNARIRRARTCDGRPCHHRPRRGARRPRRAAAPGAPPRGTCRGHARTVPAATCEEPGMSTGRAIEAITQTLRSLLTRVTAQVTARPPDQARDAGGEQLNLFLYDVAPNPAWRNLE